MSGAGALRPTVGGARFVPSRDRAFASRDRAAAARALGCIDRVPAPEKGNPQMLFLDGGFGLLLLGLWIFCIIDVITTEEYRVRNLPKTLWLIIVLLLPDIGSIAWLVAGHPWEPKSPPQTRLQRQYPEYDRPGREAATNPEDDEAFLRQLRERADQQRRKAAEERREREEREARDKDLD